MKAKIPILVIGFLCFSGSRISLAQEESVRQGVYLTVEEATRVALENNLDVQIAQFDAYSKRNDLLGALSIFDTILSAKAGYTNNQFKKSSTISGSKSQTNEYSIGVSKLLPTGTTVGLDFEDTRSFTNSSFASINPSHEGVAKVSISQALGKNFFGLIDRNQIKITRLDIESSDWTSLSRIEDALIIVQKAYWKLVLLENDLEISRQMLTKARDLFDLYRKKFNFGLTENPELFGAQANLIRRQNEALSAIDELNTVRDELLLLLDLDLRHVKIRPLDRLDLVPERVNFVDSLSKAIENRRDYKKAKNEVQAKKIDLVIKKNSLWPEVDLEASFAKNGLSGAYSKAWESISQEDNPEVFFGVTVKIPIENRMARADVNKAQIEKAKSLLLLKKAERLILTEINDLVTRVRMNLGKALTAEKIFQLQEKKLAAEEKRFRYGRSSGDQMIRYQEDLLNARLGLAKAIYDYRVSLIDLKKAEGIFLNSYWKDQL